MTFVCQVSLKTRGWHIYHPRVQFSLDCFLYILLVTCEILHLEITWFMQSCNGSGACGYTAKCLWDKVHWLKESYFNHAIINPTLILQLKYLQAAGRLGWIGQPDFLLYKYTAILSPSCLGRQEAMSYSRLIRRNTCSLWMMSCLVIYLTYLMPALAMCHGGLRYRRYWLPDITIPRLSMDFAISVKREGELL